MCDFRYYLPLKKSYYDPYGKWEKARLEKYGYMMKPVLERILLIITDLGGGYAAER